MPGTASLYTQWLFLEPQTKQSRRTTTNGASIALVAALLDLDATMVRAEDPAAVAGRVFLNRCPVLQLSER